MLKELYELQDRKQNLNLGQTVDSSLEFDLMVHSIDIFVPVENGIITQQINSLELPFRLETNGSILITLKEIENYILSKIETHFFIVNYEDARSGAIFHYGNNHNRSWTLHSITNGYS